jgi:putative hydrolase of the HAD superfamily
VRVARLAPSRRVWIFDLDNTLHDATARIFPAMHEQINAFLRREFGVDEAGANRMRQEFWLRYGTTLNGLMRHHGIHPGRFLAETHVFPELADLVVRENALKHALQRLGGMKLVFSNAPRHYVAGVLRAMGLARYFDAVYSAFACCCASTTSTPIAAHSSTTSSRTCAPRTGLECQRFG